jgi:hypothetical protein
MAEQGGAGQPDPRPDSERVQQLLPYIHSRGHTAVIAFGYGWYVVDQCIIIDFDGSWGWGGPKSATTPINSILGFLVFGLPCLIYTIFGRFTLREAESKEDFDDFDCEDEDDDMIYQSNQGEQDSRGNGGQRH